MGIKKETEWILEDNGTCIQITENKLSPGKQRTKHVDILEKFHSEQRLIIIILQHVDEDPDYSSC
jgi:hypothetical protein